MNVRDMWMAAHRYSGLLLLVFLALAALTGVALVYARPLDRALNADLFDQPAARNAPAVPQLVEGFARNHREFSVTSFPLAVPVDRRIAVKVKATSEGSPINQVFLDRASGAIVATRSNAGAFTRRGGVEWLVELHSTLLLGTAGRWFMGLLALFWLVSNIVGFYLTLPIKGAFWKQWKRSWRFSFKSVFARQMLDLHKVAGLWLFVPLTALALTSVCLNFFEEGYSPLVERFVPEPELALPEVAAKGPLDFTDAVEQARRVEKGMAEDWQPATVLYDAAQGRIGVTLSDDGELSYNDLGPIYLYFDATTGALVEAVDPYHGNTNLAMYRWIYPVHSGHIFGLGTELLVMLTGLATFALCATGLYLWWKKRPGRVLQRQKKRNRKSPA